MELQLYEVEHNISYIKHFSPQILIQLVHEVKNQMLWS